MEALLHNPVYHAFRTGDARLARGTDKVNYFDEEVSPFVAFPTDHATGFNELHELLPAGRKILYSSPSSIQTPPGWELIVLVPGLQFVYTGKELPPKPAIKLTPLTTAHVPEMIRLTQLTKPGPFGERTIEFGSFYGVIENGQLAAMTGQRFHPGNCSEISAVCTHPDHLGKGYAAALIIQQLHLIQAEGKQPFLHVRDDNSRAIALYQRLGFEASRPMNFYFLRRLA
jgi:ribosomal protein S18 acetylase RimI-like enzyme